jgi:hypothetical protein
VIFLKACRAYNAGGPTQAQPDRCCAARGIGAIFSNSTEANLHLGQRRSGRLAPCWAGLSAGGNTKKVKEKTVFKRIRNAISTLLILLVLTGCGYTKPSITPQLDSLYLAQEPPGMEPEVFAPGIVSDPDTSEYSGSFSPDGSEYYFDRFSQTSETRLLFSKVVDGKWSAPEQLAVTAEYIAFEPYVPRFRPNYGHVALVFCPN